MPRAAVIECLGRPLGASNYGVLSYGGRDGIFDVQVEKGTVSYLNISGERFCLPRRVCMWARKGIEGLRRDYGDDIYVTTQETGEEALVMEAPYRGRTAQTKFLLNSGPGEFSQVEIGWKR
jgi:hypothetical protein